MSVTISTTNKPLNPRAQDLSPKGYNRASLYSGKALDFDGVNDALSTDYAPSSNIQTVAYWVKLDSLTTNYALGGFVGSLNQFGLYYWGANANKNFGFNTWSADSYGVILPDFVDDWFYVVAEYNFSDFTQSKLFVNGQELSISQTLGTTLQRTTASRTFQIDSPSASSQEFDGKISGVKVFEGSLTAAQVSDLYLNPEKIVPDGVANSALKLWLPMMEGAGTTAYDGSGNGNHGTISGATWVSGVGAPVAQTALVGWNKLYQKVDADDGVSYSSFTSSSATEVTYASWVYTLSSSGVSGSTRTISEGVANQSVDFKIGSDGIIGSVIQTTGNSFASYTTTDHINKLTHIAFTAKRNGSIKVYMNGAEVSTAACADFDLVRLTTINVHNENITGGSGFRGYVADLAVYGRELTASEISNLYNLTDPTTISDCDLYATNAGGFIDKTGNAIVSISGSPIQTLFPQGLTASKDITGVNSVSRNAYALNLDGASWAEVHDNASLDVTTAVTLECWLYHTDTTNIEHIIGKRASSGNWLRIYSASTNTLRVERNGGAATSNVSITENAWNHILVTIDTSEVVRFYINGTQQTSASPFTPWGMDNLAPVSIGAWVTESGVPTFNSYETGQIALPRIYNRALTATEVSRNYNADKSKFGL